MWLLVFLAICFASVPRAKCHFDDDNETLALNKNCDKSNLDLPEGNIGQIPQFPWLGVLRVHLHEVSSFRVAATGVILVKEKFAIANANDVGRVPKTTLLRDSKVMFVLQPNIPWFCSVVDLMTHPEFEITTLNTISILELTSKEVFLPKPICWPQRNFNTSNELYVIGYTDENQLLEKTIFRMQYVDKSTCVEFYNRSNLLEDLTPPMQYQCGFLINGHGNCVWDNGMAIASNISGAWTLVGLIVNGPGCSAPARFLDTTTYMPWIVTSMTLDDAEEMPYGDVNPMRRFQPGKSAFGVGFKKKEKDEEVPIHTLFRRLQPLGSVQNKQEPDHTDPKYYGPHSKEMIYGKPLPQGYELGIPETYSQGFLAQLYYPNKLVLDLNYTGGHIIEDGCNKAKVLVYREKMDIKNNNDLYNMADYSISLYDLKIRNFSCVTITANQHFHEPVQFWFDYGPSLGPLSSHHPEETIKKVLIPSLLPKRPKNKTTWTPHEKLRPTFIKDTRLYYFPQNAIKHFNVRIRLRFIKNATLDLSIFGLKEPPVISREPTKKTFLRNAKVKPKTHRPEDPNDINNNFWDDKESIEMNMMYYYPNDSTVNAETKTELVVHENMLKPETEKLKREHQNLENKCDNAKYDTSILVKELIVCCLVLKVLA